MIDVVVSFSSREREITRIVVEGLRSFGLNVWFDEDLGGRSINSEIQARIHESRVVVGLLSESYVESAWCLGEVEIGLSKLVVARVDDLNLDKIPIPLRSLDIIDLSDWTGSADHTNWRLLIKRCCELAGPSSKKPSSKIPDKSSEARDKKISDHMTINNNQGRVGNIAGVNRGIQKAIIS